MRLVYINNGVTEDFKMSGSNAMRQELPKEFVELHKSDMQKYKDLQKQIKGLIGDSTKLLDKLKSDFEKEIREVNPEYFL